MTVSHRGRRGGTPVSVPTQAPNVAHSGAASAIWVGLLAFLGLLPGSREGVIHLGGLMMLWREFALIAAAALLLAGAAVWGRPLAVHHGRRGKRLPGEIWIAVLWTGWVVGRWVGAGRAADVHAVSLLLLNVAAFVIPLWVIHLAAAAGRLQRLYLWTVVTVIGLLTIYFAESVGLTGFRTDKTIDAWMGVHRLNGPLSSANNMGALILLSLGCCLHRAHERASARRALWWVATLWLLVLSLMTGSRGGLAVIFLYVGLLLLAARRIGPMLVLGGAVAMALLLAAQFMSFERYKTTYEPARWQSYQTAMEGWLSSRGNFWCGFGLGQVYRWHERELEMLMDRVTPPGPELLPTPIGESLSHPHSTVLYLLVETGLVGAALLLWLPVAESLHGVLAILSPLRRDAGPPDLATLAGLAAACAFPLHLINTYFLHQYGVSMCAWFLVLIARRLRLANAGLARARFIVRFEAAPEPSR